MAHQNFTLARNRGLLTAGMRRLYESALNADRNFTPV
jgi:hypothetical protein